MTKYEGLSIAKIAVTEHGFDSCRYVWGYIKSIHIKKSYQVFHIVSQRLVSDYPVLLDLLIDHHHDRDYEKNSSLISSSQTDEPF